MMQAVFKRRHNITAREEALQAVLLGQSDLADPDEAERALSEAESDLATRSSGVGYGFVRNLGFHGDAVRLLYAITDGTRAACFQVIISGSRLPALQTVEDIDAWVYDRLPTRETAQSTYEEILGRHPIKLR